MRKRKAGMALALMLSAAVSFQSLAFYNTPESKKGLLMQHVDLVQDGVELGVKQAIFNIPMSEVLNNSNYLPSVDAFVNRLHANDITVTAILLNDWQTTEPDLLPVSAPAAGAAYYAFNTNTQAGAEAVSRIANKLASRYRDKISNWVIGNEVNDGNTWNYLGVEEIDAYTQSYATAFRSFYDAIKTHNPEARVFVPFDFRWNCPYIPGRYQVKQMLPKLNELLKDTDYGIAWHAYPEDFTNADFMNASPNARPGDINTPIINLKNLDVLTDYMQRTEMLSPNGSVRHLILSEQGFSSARGEDVQAAAIQQAYEIAKNNPYVEGFFLNRQVDDRNLVQQNFSFGLWSCDMNAAKPDNPAGKKQAWETYRNLQ